MPRSGFVWYGSQQVAAVKFPWTPEEEVKLAHGFLDLDLDGEDLHKWCRKNGVNRTPGAIDARLQKFNFFMDTEPPAAEHSKTCVARNLTAKLAAKAMKAADNNLANQISMARIEAAVVPLFRQSDEKPDKIPVNRKYRCVVRNLTRKRTALATREAEKDLANEILLAKNEAATASLFQLSDLELNGRSY